MNLYVFGSFCRGEIDQFSDIDLLIIKNRNEDSTLYDLEKYSIYKKERIEDLWNEGNPFAWHLYKESKLIFSNEKINFLKQLGKPNDYFNMENDLRKFHKLFEDSYRSCLNSNDSLDFDFSMIFLAIRNFATCFSLGHLKQYNFSRNSSLNLDNYSIKISDDCYTILKNSRILSTRGIGNNLTELEHNKVLNEINKISNWFESINKII